MAKVTGPLFSTSAVGTISKAINFQISRGLAVVRNYFKPTYRRTNLQNEIRILFQEGIKKWQATYENIIGRFNDLSWDDIQVWKWVQKNKKRSGRCGFMENWMVCKGKPWRWYPICPTLPVYEAKDKIPDYAQIISNLETLTGLQFCFEPDALFLSDGKFPIGGFCTGRGSIVVFNTIHLTNGYLYFTYLIAHELTHALLMQHGYNSTIYTKDDHEIIATECGQRIADGQLEPIYKYKGKTLSEIVPWPECPD
jgi:hypothetical protein